MSGVDGSDRCGATSASGSSRAASYLRHDTRVFGKRPDGTRQLAATIALLPYLVALDLVWQLVRLTSREPAVSSTRPRHDSMSSAPPSNASPQPNAC